VSRIIAPSRLAAMTDRDLYDILDNPDDYDGGTVVDAYDELEERKGL